MLQQIVGSQWCQWCQQLKLMLPQCLSSLATLQCYAMNIAGYFVPWCYDHLMLDGVVAFWSYDVFYLSALPLSSSRCCGFRCVMQCLRTLQCLGVSRLAFCLFINVKGVGRTTMATLATFRSPVVGVSHRVCWPWSQNLKELHDPHGCHMAATWCQVDITKLDAPAPMVSILGPKELLVNRPRLRGPSCTVQTEHAARSNKALSKFPCWPMAYLRSVWMLRSIRSEMLASSLSMICDWFVIDLWLICDICGGIWDMA
jgi:hypothetical protein